MSVEFSATSKRPGNADASRGRQQEASPDARATLQTLPGSLLEWAILVRDHSYQRTALGPAIVEFLAWMRTGDIAERTLDTYERALSRGALLFPKVSLEEWGDSEMAFTASAFSTKQRRTRVAAWRSFFRWAIQQRRIDRNPCDSLRTMKTPPQHDVDVFSDPEIELLTSLPVRDGALMQILFDAGLRKSEAINLRLLHLRGSQLVVLKGKGSKDRLIPASSEVVQKVNELALLDGVNEPDHLWYCRPGGGQVISRSRPIVDSAFHRWWIRCLDQAGVPYRNPHVARHTFATRWLRRGGRLDLLSMAMGHASIKTTHDLYSHLDTTDLAAEFALLFPALVPANEETGRG